jgi:hypothetical protein
VVEKSPLALEALSPEQRELWGRVCGLWERSRSKDRALVGAAIHPQYVGWDMSAELPHDKAAAVASVTGDTPELQDYVLVPRSIQAYDHVVGVVHYSYRATIQPRGASPLDVTGKWTEVYLRQNDEWVMVAVSGRPDPALTALRRTDAAARLR